MKKIVVVDLDYFPIVNANTRIISRILENLSDTYQITLLCQNSLAAAKYEKCGNVVVYRCDYHSLVNDNASKDTIMDKFNILRIDVKRRLLKDDINYKDAYFFIKQAEKAVVWSDIQLIISFSNPFVSHYCASALSKKFDIPWISYYFDPFFSNYTLSKKCLMRRKKVEEKIISNAEKVIITKPTDHDYIKSNISFNSKIISIEMPGIQKQLHIHNSSENSLNTINCFFVGNLYWSIRNPEMTFQLFNTLPSNIILHIVGGCFDKDPTEVNNIIGKYKNIIYEGLKDPDVSTGLMENANILVNIGNSINNQMPSKIFEYISSGKPIINIYKIQDCPSLHYLKKYPLVLNIYEPEIEKNTDEILKKVISFCYIHKNDQVPLTLIENEFIENTDEYVCLKLQKEIEKVTNSYVKKNFKRI